MGIFYKVGLLARSVSGWVYIISFVVPLAAAYYSYIVEKFPISFTIFLTTATLAASSISVYYLIRIWDYLAVKIGDNAEKRRIITELKDYEMSGYNSIQLGIAAGIWTNTIEEGSIKRHICANKLIAATVLGLIEHIDMPLANRPTSNLIMPDSKTHLPIASLGNYFETEIFK